MSRSGRMLIVLLFIACSWSSDRPLSAAIHRPAAFGRNIDQDYVLALTTANEFLEAQDRSPGDGAAVSGSSTALS